LLHIIFKEFFYIIIFIKMKEKLLRLIEVKRQLKELEKEEAEIKQAFLEGNCDYEKIGNVEISKKQRPTITLLKDVDMKVIQEKYPSLCDIIYGFDIKKVTPEELEEIKNKYKEAYYESITVDAKKLNEVTKEYTSQKITTYVEVKGI